MDERIELKWKCGHTETYTFGYTTNDMKAKMRLMASTLNICDTCQSKVAVDRAWRITQMYLEPVPVELTGSIKQIEWARSIRTTKYEALAHVLDCLREAYKTRQDEWPAIAHAISPVVNDVSIWSAYWQSGAIIDRRNINWTNAFSNALSRAGLKVKGLTK
jgi:hypothetical protein